MILLGNVGQLGECVVQGLVEAALNRPRCTQRLLLQNEDLEEAKGFYY